MPGHSLRRPPVLCPTPRVPESSGGQIGEDENIFIHKYKEHVSELSECSGLLWIIHLVDLDSICVSMEKSMRACTARRKKSSASDNRPWSWYQQWTYRNFSPSKVQRPCCFWEKHRKKHRRNGVLESQSSCRIKRNCLKSCRTLAKCKAVVKVSGCTQPSCSLPNRVSWGNSKLNQVH